MEKPVPNVRFLIFLLGLGFASPGTHVTAAEIKIHPDAGPVHYYVQGEPISACAGNPVTPGCALDTWWSCVVQEHKNHCETVGIKDMVFRVREHNPETGSSPNDKPAKLSALKPIRFVRIEDGDIPPDSSLQQWLRPGDVEIEYLFDSCEGPEPSDCKWEIVGQENLFLEKKGKYWHVFAWSNEAGSIVCEDFTPPYGRHCRYWLINSAYAEYVRTIDPARDAGIRGYRSIDPAPLMGE